MSFRKLAKDNEEFLKVLAKRARLGVDGERRGNTGGLLVDVLVLVELVSVFEQQH